MGITKLRINKVSAKIVDDMLMKLLILLSQYHTNRLLRRGHIYQKVTAIVGWTKHGGQCRGSLQSIERLLGSLNPYKQSVFLVEMHEASSQIGKLNYEYSQEVHHTLQTLNMSNVTRGRQLNYCLNLQRIDPYTLLGNNEPY